jgi:hypothetical protein
VHKIQWISSVRDDDDDDADDDVDDDDKIKRKMGGKQCLRVFNGGKVKQSDRWENIIIEGQENSKMCVKKTSWEDVEWRNIAQAGAKDRLLLSW